MRKFRKLTSMRAEIEWNEKLLIDLEWPITVWRGSKFSRIAALKEFVE